MELKCTDCMVTFESESLKDCPSCGTTDFIYQLSDNQVLAYEKQKLKKENKDLLSANINMHDALDLKSERIQELKKQLATATEALTRIKFNGLFKKAGPHGDYAPYNVDTQTKIAEQALAEIGGEDE